MAVSLSISYSVNSQSIANNTSNVTVRLAVSWTYGSFSRISQSGTCVIDGKSYSFSSTFNTTQKTSGSQTIYTKTVDVAHSTDGSKKLAISGSFATGGNSGTVTASISRDLTKIPRAATITSAPNFNDEANPTINYDNPLGSAATTLQACISIDGSKADIAYRDISKTGSSYTFNLTDAERKVLRQAAKNSNSISVRFYVATTIGGETYRKYLTKTLSIVNANPTLSPTVKDNGSVSVTLTGDANNKLIKGYNSMAVAANATTKKEATIKSYKITCGGKSITTASGTLSDVESGDFVFTVTDSRGNTASATISKTLVNYKELTCNLVYSPPTIDSYFTLNIKGNYFRGTFGTVTNTLSVQYRMKVNNESWGAWQTVTHTVNNNGTYLAVKTFTDLDYRNVYTFQARALDKIYNGDTESAKTSKQEVIKVSPLFDWGENDFNFNVPVTFSGGADIPNKLLWSSSYYMTEGQTAKLSEPISRQTSGIVLVFSRYDITNSTALNEHFCYHFVPKQIIALQEGKGSIFNMSTSNETFSASKYLYIYDTEIQGHANNNATGTGATGVTYDNKRFVLRYVIGV